MAVDFDSQANHTTCFGVEKTDELEYTAEADGAGATKWGKLKSGVGWISLDFTKRI